MFLLLLFLQILYITSSKVIFSICKINARSELNVEDETSTKIFCTKIKNIGAVSSCTKISSVNNVYK